MTRRQYNSEHSPGKQGLPGAKTPLALALAAGCLIAAHGAVVHAQIDNDAGVITSGPFSIEPLLTAEIAYNDNIFDADTDEVDSWVTRVEPTLNTAIETGGQRYSLSYEGDYGWYADSSDDDYEDHEFTAEADLDLGYRNHFTLGAGYTMETQARGTGITEGFDPANPSVDKPIEIDTTEYNLEYAYGSTESTGRFELAGDYRDRDYENDRAETEYEDREYYGARATFYYRVLPATSLLFEVRGQQIDYDLTQPGTAKLDSETIRYLAGVTWDITDQTSGTIKLGQVDRTFDDDSRGDFKEFDWEVNISWSPVSYSRFDLVTEREPREAYGDADFRDIRRYGLTWTHGWTERFETRLEASYEDEVFEGIDREEETYDYAIAFNYQMRRWLSFELGAEYSNRDSNIADLEYNRTVYRLSTSLSL